MKSPARVIFAGTPEFALPAIQCLHAENVSLVAVYTQPDRPSGRGRKLTPVPVKRWAQDNAIPVEQPLSLKTPDVQAHLAAYKPDLMVVAAYGLLLPPAVLELPRRGCVNIHASLLPRWRGAAPIQRAILAGDRQTGISLMQMDAGLDTGPVLARAAVDIGEGETAGELHDRLAELGAELLRAHLPAILAGERTAEPQDEQQAVHAAKISKHEAWLDWTRPADNLARQVRAFNPWPVAQTFWGDKILRVWRAEPLGKATGDRQPGRVVRAGAEGIDVACGRGCLRLTELQLPGKRVLPAAALVNAYTFDEARFHNPDSPNAAEAS